MTTRIPAWQSALQALVRARWNQPFARGQHDCALFAADCVLAITGVDPAAAYRGQYTDEIGAARLLVRAGGMVAAVTAALGAEIAPGLAQVADVGLHQVDGCDALAVCAGLHWLAAGPDGLVALPLSSISTAWRCA